jgi:hypothetical protein
MELDQVSPTFFSGKTTWSSWTHLPTPGCISYFLPAAPGRPAGLAGHTTMWLDQLLPTFCSRKTSWSSWTHHHGAGSAVSYLLPLEDQLVLLDTPRWCLISCPLPAAPGRPAGLFGHTKMVLDQLSPTCCPWKTSWSS